MAGIPANPPQVKALLRDSFTTIFPRISSHGTEIMKDAVVQLTPTIGSRLFVWDGRAGFLGLENDVEKALMMMMMMMMMMNINCLGLRNSPPEPT